MVATKLLTTPKRGSTIVFIQIFKIVNISLMENHNIFHDYKLYFVNLKNSVNLKDYNNS